MVKAKEFWHFLCNKMDYRLFSGVPCLDLKPLYDTMSSDFMHYTPAVDEYAAFGISLGSTTAGADTGVLIDINYLNLAEDWMQFCFEYKTHLVVITNGVPARNLSHIVFQGDYIELETYLSKKKRFGKLAMIVLEGIV